MSGETLPILPLLAAAAHEGDLVAVLVQLCVIIAAARVFAELAHRLGQPYVVGEIAAGLILGPSVLGQFLPQTLHRLFDPAVAPVFTVLSQLGLILLLFLVGLEFDFGHLRTRGHASVLVSLAGIAVPFGLGLGLGWIVHPVVAPGIPRAGFCLFMATAMCITAIPILGRIMMELNIARSRLGAVTITAAAVDDAVGWILLAAVSAVVGTGFDPVRSALMLGQTAAFLLLMVLVAGPLLRRWVRWTLARHEGELSLNALVGVLVVLLLCAAATSLIGIFAIFGAFILGAVLSGEEAFRAAVSRRLSHFVTVFFLPIFFTYTGLRTNVGTLSSAGLWLIAVAVCAVAIAGKFAGCAVAARAGGLAWREAGCVGVMMNTRALMELIVINVGRDLGVIPDSVFCMLVMMALLTTVMTTPVLLRLAPGTELGPLIAASGFRTGRGPRHRLPGDPTGAGP